MSEDEKYEQLRQVCVSYRNDCEKLENKIADLEAKLAEKEIRIAELEDKDWYEATIKQLEEQNARLIEERDGYYENYSICWKDNEQLKQQLAEKEDEIEKLNNKIASNSKWLKLLDKQFVQIRNHNQDKIELLEKVKELFDCKYYYCYGDNNINIVINRNKFNEQIDTLISEIKGE